MFRVLLYLLMVAVVGTGFGWLASYSGDLVLTVAGTRMTVSLLTAGIAFFLLFIATLFVWWLLKSIIRAPFLLKRHIHNRRKDHGYQLLSAGLIAAFAGDSATARRMARKSSRVLDGKKEVLLPFLEAQAKLLDHDEEGAVKLFETMRDNPQTRLLALKGLYRAALESNAKEAATQYAAEAAALNPGLKWASLATLDGLAAKGDWNNALTLFDNYTKAQPKTTARSERLLNQRVVLMAGQAQEMVENYPDEARRIALKAHKLQPLFVPAANIAARILFSLDELRKGSKLVEAVWRENPHPDLGLTYVNAKGGESAATRLKRARQLAHFNPESRESRMLVARTAFEAGELALARENAENVAETEPTESTFLLLADIETAETGNQGKIRSWLAKAVRAKPDMAWVADDISLPEWQPVSPITGHLGACVWRTPSRRPGGLSRAERDAAGQGNLTATLPAFTVAADDDKAEQAGKASRPAAGSRARSGRDTSSETVFDNASTRDTTASPSGKREQTAAAPITRLVVDDPGVGYEEEEK